jgi:PAS domain S-box-containing protein
VTSWNPAAEKLFGYSREEAMGQDVDSLVASTAAVYHEALRLSQQTMEAGEVHLTTRRTRKDGSLVNVDVRAAPIRVGGEMVGLYALYHDISELQRAREQAEAATQAKSAFLAMMSHEIRTPMNGIIGISDLAMNGKMSAEQREYIGMVRSSASALLQLINDILDFSKIEAGVLHFERTEFLLRDTLAESVKAHALRAEEKGIELIWRTERNVPDVLVGDPLRLRQVITNLLSNAIKFTAQGEVELFVGLSETSHTQADLLFAVRDTGIGIAQQELEAVFAPFSQGDMSITRQYGGTGLGLTICDRLVKMMGGEISVRSKPDEGSIFYFTATFALPVESSSEAKRPSGAGMIDLKDVKALVCEDNPSQLVAITEVLNEWQVLCRATDNLSEALSVLEKAAATGAPFDVAILDAGSCAPEEKRLLQSLRAHTNAHNVRVVMLMPFSAAGTRTKNSRDRTMVRVTKPFSHIEFKQAIAAALGRFIPEKPRVSATPLSAQSLHILLAEDNDINIRFARGLLEGMGHRITVARNGLEAVQAVGGNIDEAFDLALMDVQMPIMSGLEATGAIRMLERGTSRRMPIIAMTANAMRGDRERCLEAGMDEYVAKPIVIAKLVEAIESTLSRGLPRDAKYVPGSRASRKARKQAPGSASNAVPYDRRAVLEVLDGDNNALRELAQMFLTDYPPLLSKASRILDDGDIESLPDVAHTLKGMIGNFSASNASKAAQSFYRLAHEGNRDKAAKAFQRLESRLAELAAALLQDLTADAEPQHSAL